MCRKQLCNLHRAIDGLAADSFVYQVLSFGVARIERLPHKDVHKCRCRSDSARQPLCAAGALQETEFCLGQTDQIVAVFSNPKVASESELEGAGYGCSGNGGRDRLWHALAQRPRFLREP